MSLIFFLLKDDVMKSTSNCITVFFMVKNVFSLHHFSIWTPVFQEIQIALLYQTQFFTPAITYIFFRVLAFKTWNQLPDSTLLIENLFLPRTYSLITAHITLSSSSFIFMTLLFAINIFIVVYLLYISYLSEMKFLCIMNPSCKLLSSFV